MDSELATMNELLEDRDPSKIGFPPMLPVELAMKIDTPAKVCAAYGISREEFEVIAKHPIFIKAYSDAVESLKIDGVSFKLKAKLQAEDLLATSYAMAKDGRTTDAVRQKIIADTVRWAGYDTKAGEQGSVGTGFSIQINLG